MKPAAAARHSLTAALWPLAAGYFIYQCAIRPASMVGGGDMAISRAAAASLGEGGNPYVANLYGTATALYPPSAALLSTPLAVMPLTAASVVYSLLAAAGLAAAVVLTLRTLEVSLSGPWTPVAFLGTAFAHPVLLNAIDENYGLPVLVTQALATLLLARRRWLAAGLAIGLGAALKPPIPTLYILALVAGGWPAAVVGVILPGFLIGMAVSLHPSGFAFFTVALPALLSGNPAYDYLNLAPAALARLGIPGPLIWAIRGGGAVAAIAVARARWQSQAPLGLRLVECNGILSVGALLALSFAYPHHLVALVPLVLAVARPDSWMRSPVVASGVFLVMADVTWQSHRFPGSINGFLAFIPTVGLLTILTGLGAAAIMNSRPQRPADPVAEAA